MSSSFPTRGSEPPPPPGSPPRTLSISLAVGLSIISFAVLLVTPFVFWCRRSRYRSSALPGDRCGGDSSFPVETTLPAFSYAPEDGEQGSGARECAVCLGAVKEGEMVRQLPSCMHLYHVVCIDRWLAAHRTCPLCRSQLDSSMVHGVGIGSTGPGAGRYTST